MLQFVNFKSATGINYQGTPSNASRISLHEKTLMYLLQIRVRPLRVRFVSRSDGSASGHRCDIPASRLSSMRPELTLKVPQGPTVEGRLKSGRRLLRRRPRAAASILSSSKTMREFYSHTTSSMYEWPGSLHFFGGAVLL